ncbi:MAG: hypothetical protein J6B67_00135 [Oscillospiraceae bacterium]|nr:hypothetical protein [Oscillospiraceae bacterium]
MKQAMISMPFFADFTNFWSQERFFYVKIHILSLFAGFRLSLQQKHLFLGAVAQCATAPFSYAQNAFAAKW